MASKEKPIREREDGRRPLMTYLDADLIKELKKAALDDDCNVYQIVEEASRDWLAKRSGGKNKR